YFSGDVVAFFWSPDGQHLAYLTVDTSQPGPVGRIGGLAAPRVKQQPTAYFTWHVIDLQTQHTLNLISFEPADAMVYMAQYFDQFAQSIEVWSPDSQSLVLAGTPLNGRSGVYVIDASSANSPATYVGPGDFAIWSWK
ncbi:MAG TPA: hypothetical protein VFK30_02635, partial [Anaerolineae bacterium]|nr:hypothetical protein [Anaerolineae bacterium]